ncbi:MAG: hypothetical protein BWX88_04379 [Planctomycetes bacterium ADurb.Bin126]|nr:MAG: hypothetical protein BWX88_04379 [Planctomycetes bacterium ADurb.Bin126]
MDLIFEWDPRKARTNLRKHGVGVDEARTVFADYLSITRMDESHSSPTETRRVMSPSEHR